MVKHYLVFLGVVLEFLAAIWLIGNPHSFSDAMLAFLLHAIAAVCFAMGTHARFNADHDLAGRLSLFCLSILLPIAGPLLFWVLTREVHSENSTENKPWRVIQAPVAYQKKFYNNRVNATSLRATVKYNKHQELRLDALKQTIHLGPHAAKPILNAALNDSSELVRKTAFELLEGRNTRLHVNIDDLLEVMDKHPDSLRDTQVQAEAATQLWELAYQGLVDPEAADGFLERANDHLHRAINSPDSPPELYFQRGRIRLKMNETVAAREDFNTALEKGLSADEVLPYLAECAYLDKQYQHIPTCLNGLSDIRKKASRSQQMLSTWKTLA